MRTISENIQSMKDVTVLDKVSFSGVSSTRTEKRSCFYELGADRTAIFGAYSPEKESALIQKVRNYSIK